MANQEHIERLKRNLTEWNQWRRNHPEMQVNLNRADLNRADLSGADLSGADLSGADLNLTDLRDANLNRADLSYANLRGADLRDANLRGAGLSYANLSGANLKDANLKDANLRGADLRGADLDKADLRNIQFGDTFFVRIDLNNIKGLETAAHYGPSTVNINTVTLPHDERTRLHFLRGVGFTETQIEYLPSLLTPRPIEYSSLFISYAHQDETVAKRLHGDLRKHDVPCWFAPHDMKIGDEIRSRIDEAIRLHDKLLLILSEHSVVSQWVEYELETALKKEGEGRPNVLFPIRLDDAVLKSATSWASHVQLTRHIGDFTNWQDEAAYQQAFDTLLRHLKITRQ